MNEKEQLISNHSNSLRIFETNDICYTTGINYALVYKYLTGFSDMGLIEKHKGFWRLEGCKSEYAQGSHARLLTKSLSVILKSPFKSIIYREKTISEISLRPDSLVMLIDENQQLGRVFVFEEINHEDPNFTAMKKNTWENWEGATEFLSLLFQYAVPHFDFITSDELQDYLKTIQEGL